MQKDKKKHIYIIGIGGKGLTSIAEFCISKGYQVSGSDIRQSPETDAVTKKGAHVYFNQDGSHVTFDIDLVVYSSIIPESHPERVRAGELGMQTLERAHFLGQLTKEFERISVAGSHGKSTTSALTALALKSIYGEINAITGSYIKEFDSYQSSGNTRECVLEACEYSKSFLHIPGDYTLITTLEKSHMEYFKNEEHMNRAFKDFVSCHKPSATLIINGDNQILKDICTKHTGEVVTCGFGTNNQYVIRDVELKSHSSVFSVYKLGTCLHKNITIKIPGLYNILNVALVYVLLDQKGLDSKEFKNILRSFTGVGRRFEISQHKKTTFVDDFAHHPTQVKNLILGLKQFFPHKQICAVFEPRQYHLIKTFLKEYGKSFNLADHVYVTDIVPALGDSDEDMRSLSAEDVVNSIKKHSVSKKVQYGVSYQAIADSLKLQDLSKTVVATIGAGSIFKVRDLLINGVQ